MASGRIDIVIERGVCRDPKILPKQCSTLATRGKQRTKDLLDHRPACLWSQFHCGKRLATPTQAQHSTASGTKIVDPAADAMRGNQKATPFVFVEVHGEGARLARLATAYGEYQHGTKDRQAHPQMPQLKLGM